MSFDQKLFSRIFDAYQWLKRKPIEEKLKNKATFVDLLPRLKIIANGIAGFPVNLYPVRNGLGYTTERSLVLPIEIAWFDQRELNEEIYLCRTLFGALAIREATFNSKVFRESSNWIHSIAKVCEVEFPGIIRSLRNIDHASSNKLLRASEKEIIAWFTLSRGTYPSRESNHDQSTELKMIELEASKNQKADSIENDRPSLAKARTINTENPNPVVHVFEKAITADDYQGGSRDIDPDTESNASSEALSELNMDQVVRALGETGSLYRGGLHLYEEEPTRLEAHESIDENSVFHYPEWSAKKLNFLQDWCTVYEEEIDEKKVDSFTLSPSLLAESKRLKQKLERFANRPVWLRNQQDGPELDLDAIIRFKSELKAGSSTQKNFYLERRKIEKDIAVLVLADVSSSTDGWILNQRVFDTIQDSLQIVSETFKEVQSNVSLGAFYSNTRRKCTYLNLKKFEENWNNVPQKINSLKPQGYTRIGPAVRHATQILKNQKARKKLLLIISDAKPTDYDAYEGAHGESDVHHAILEAKNKQITVKGLAICAPKAGHVKRIYGAGGFESFTSHRELSKHLINAYQEALGH